MALQAEQDWRLINTKPNKLKNTYTTRYILSVIPPTMIPILKIKLIILKNKEVEVSHYLKFFFLFTCRKHGHVYCTIGMSMHSSERLQIPLPVHEQSYVFAWVSMLDMCLCILSLYASLCSITFPFPQHLLMIKQTKVLLWERMQKAPQINSPYIWIF